MQSHKRSILSRLSAICLVLVMLTAVSRAQAKVNLVWSPMTNNLVYGFNIYYGGAKGVYTNKTTAGPVTNLTIPNLKYGVTYHFAATTYSLAGAESALSLDVEYTVPFPPAEIQIAYQSRKFALSVTGVANHAYTIQATPDLINWTNIGTVSSDSNGLFSFADSNALSFTRRFYRTRS